MIDVTQKKFYIYCIRFDCNPVYIGSTSNIYKRQLSHNKELRIAKMASFHTRNLYNYLYNKIDRIDLEIIYDGYDDIVLLSNYVIEYRKYIQEEKFIRNCIYKKQIPLLNMKWPCKNWVDISGNFTKRTSKNNNIIYDKYVGDKEIYKDICNYYHKLSQGVKNPHF